MRLVSYNHALRLGQALALLPAGSAGILQSTGLKLATLACACRDKHGLSPGTLETAVLQSTANDTLLVR